MSEEVKVETTPLKPGQLVINSVGGEKKEMPNGEILQIHAEEVGTVDFGEGARLEVKFVVDGGPDEVKGQTFKKWFNPSAGGPKAGIVKLGYAVFGQELTEKFDPTTLLNRPLQVMFAPDKYDGRDIQIANYLPPAKGQSAPKKDVVLTADDDLDGTFEEVFGPGVKEVS